MTASGRSATGSATVVISTRADLASPAVNASDGLTTLSRQYVASGLAADTQYFYRITTAQWAVRGVFRTSPALSGTGRVRISKGWGGAINYGTTSSLGSSCTSPCDLAPTKGLIYHNATGSVQALVVK